VPVPGEDDLEYWDALREHRLVLSRCDHCGWYTQRRQLACVSCQGESFTWTPVSGRGTIYTYTVARQTWTAGFAAELPYVVVVVAIEEQPGLHLTTNLVGAFDIGELGIDLPVTAVFEERGPATVLQFELAGSGRV
jgi:uncharacterized OB-fold protein